MYVLEVIIGILILVFLVVMHELGHALAARRSGVVVEEFGIGLPPTALKKMLKNGVLFTINWLPLGGYVKLKGEYDAAKGEGDYGSASFWKKTKILFAGVFANWLVAIVILTTLALIGMPKILPNQFYIASDAVITKHPVEIASVAKDLSAEKAGLIAGDIVLEIADQSIDTPTKLIDVVKNKKGQEVSVIYSREGVKSSADIVLGTGESGIFGASLSQRGEIIKSTWSAPIVGVATTAQFTWLTFTGLGDLIGNLFSSNIGQVSESVAGPIGILGSIFPSAVKGGVVQLLLLTAIVSLSLAVMNVLPIPALDGGRWMTMVAFKLFKKDLTKVREEIIQSIGFYALMTLVIIITVSDVLKLF